MPDYDPKIIHKFADRLYSQAASILIAYPLFVGILFVGGNYIFLYFSRVQISNWLFFLSGALIGYLLAYEKAFKLKLEAQTALCQAKIEENTRKVS